MPDLPSADELLGTMLTDATNILNADIKSIQGFSQSQLKKIAEQGAWCAAQEALGTFNGNPELRDHFVTGLAELMRLLLKTLQGVILVTIEKIWNAWVKVLWGALDKAAGFALPRPSF